MKILHISDTHGLHHQINIPNDIDILAFTGDESNHRDPYRNEAEFYDFAQWFIDLPIKHKLFIVGNHSTYIFHNEKTVKEYFQKNNITWLHKSSVVIDGVNFYGDGISPRFGDWVYTTDRAKTNKHWDLIPEDTQVLLTHTPPKGILDITENRLHEIELVGDSALWKKVTKLPLLKAQLFGHIHCLTPDYEVLTNNGWKFYKDVLLTDKVFNYSEVNKSLEYDSIEEIIISEYDGDMYRINNSAFSLDATPKHKIVHFNKDEELTYSSIESIFNTIKVGDKIKIPTTFDYFKEEYKMSDLEIRLIAWVASDGSREGNRWRFHLKKERKISRIKKLLEELGIEFNTGIMSKTGSVKISFLDLDFKYTKPISNAVLNFSRRQCRILINEYLHTDGNFTNSAKFPKALGQLSSSKITEIDILMEVLIKSGYKFIGYIKPNHKNFHCNINIANDSIKHISIRKEHVSKYNYSGVIWCLKTTNNNFIIRKKGKIMLTGNSSKDIINTGTRTVDKVTFSNATAVTDAQFNKGITFHGNIIEI